MFSFLCRHQPRREGRPILADKPAWVVGNEILKGAVGYEVLKSAIAKTRNFGLPSV